MAILQERLRPGQCGLWLASSFVYVAQERRELLGSLAELQAVQAGFIVWWGGDGEYQSLLDCEKMAGSVNRCWGWHFSEAGALFPFETSDSYESDRRYLKEPFWSDISKINWNLCRFVALISAFVQLWSLEEKRWIYFVIGWAGMKGLEN